MSGAEREAARRVLEGLGSPDAAVVVDELLIVEVRRAKWSGEVASLKYSRSGRRPRWALTVWGGAGAPGVEAEEALAELFSAMGSAAPAWRVAELFLRFVGEYVYGLMDGFALRVRVLLDDDGESGVLVAKTAVVPAKHEP